MNTEDVLGANNVLVAVSGTSNVTKRCLCMLCGSVLLTQVLYIPVATHITPVNPTHPIVKTTY